MTHQKAIEEGARANISKVIENLRFRVKQKKYTALTLYKKIDSSNDGTINLQELMFFLRAFSPEITMTEGTIIFHMIDSNGSDSISLNEFTDFFNLSEIVESKALLKGIDEQHFDDIIKEIHQALADSSMTGQFVFEYEKLRMPKKDFLALLGSINFKNERFPNFNDFMTAISTQNSNTVVDLDKFKYMMNSFKQEFRSKVATAHSNDEIEIFLSDI